MAIPEQARMSDDESSRLFGEQLRQVRALLDAVKDDTAETRLRIAMLEAGLASLSYRTDRLLTELIRLRKPVDMSD
jgi:hypothetical protein